MILLNEIICVPKLKSTQMRVFDRMRAHMQARTRTLKQNTYKKGKDYHKFDSFKLAVKET